MSLSLFELSKAKPCYLSRLCKLLAWAKRQEIHKKAQSIVTCNSHVPLLVLVFLCASLPSLNFTPSPIFPSFLFPLSSECLCNSHSYRLVKARIRASLLWSCSPREKDTTEENILKSKITWRGAGRMQRWRREDGRGTCFLKAQQQAKHRRRRSRLD